MTAWLRTADGVTLSARHDPPLAEVPPPEASCFVVVHGFTGSWRRPEVRAVVQRLRRHGGVVSFDLRGHGDSGGLTTVGASEHPDVAAAVSQARWLGYRRVVTVGFSLGAVVAVRHAGLIGGVDAVVAVSGASRWNYRGTSPMRRLHLGMATPLGRAVLARAFGTRVAPDGWDPVPLPPDAVAGRIAPTPLLVVHGDGDHYLPAEHAYWLAGGAGPTATLWIERGMGHAEVAVSGDLVDRLAGWASTVTAGAAASARMRP